MENGTRSINLQEICYPVFKLGVEKPLTVEGVILYIRHYIDENNLQIQKYKIIDDTNVSGDTLAIRRLKLLKDNVPLKALSKAVFFLGDLIKLATRQMWFIDSRGLLFQYKRTKSVKLIFKKIKLMHYIPSGGAIIEVENISSRFKCLHSPREGEQWAGLLAHNKSYILYGLYVDRPKDTWRMI